MGPYLSEPIKTKSMHKGVGNGFSFCVSEMQGTRGITQAGGRPWRTQPFTSPT